MSEHEIEKAYDDLVGREDLDPETAAMVARVQQTIEEARKERALKGKVLAEQELQRLRLSSLEKELKLQTLKTQVSALSRLGGLLANLPITLIASFFEAILVFCVSMVVIVGIIAQMFITRGIQLTVDVGFITLPANWDSGDFSWVVLFGLFWILTLGLRIKGRSVAAAIATDSKDSDEPKKEKKKLQ